MGLAKLENSSMDFNYSSRSSFVLMIDTKTRIKQHEGFVPSVYEDTLGFKTIGFGHLVTETVSYTHLTLPTICSV